MKDKYKLSRVFLLKLTALVIILIAVYLHWFYVPPSERAFLSAASKAFNSNKVVSIKDIVPFKFDRVCLSRGDSLGHYVSPGISNQRSVINTISRNYVSLVFFSEKHLTQIYGFRGSEKLKISGKEYWFLTRFEGTECIDADHAALQATDFLSAVGLSYEIILTGGK